MMFILYCANVAIFLSITCFQFLTILNKSPINMVEQLSLWENVASFGYIPKSSIAGSLGKSVPNFLRKCHVDFLSDCKSLHSHLGVEECSPCIKFSVTCTVICVIDLSNTYRYKKEIMCTYDQLEYTLVYIKSREKVKILNKLCQGNI